VSDYSADFSSKLEELADFLVQEAVLCGSVAFPDKKIGKSLIEKIGADFFKEGLADFLSGNATLPHKTTSWTKKSASFSSSDEKSAE